jgi:hypothetical protein
MAAALTEQIKRIGIKRFLFGSDYNVQTPADQIENLRKRGLTKQEWQILKENCPPGRAEKTRCCYRFSVTDLALRSSLDEVQPENGRDH